MKTRKVKMILPIFILLGILFGAVYRSNKAGTVIEDGTEISKTESSEIELNEEAESADTADTDIMLPPSQAFTSVFRNQKTFHYSNKILGEFGPTDNCCEGYLQEVMDEKEIVTTRFAVVDMDGDGLAEIVLELDNYRGFLVFHYEAGEIIGYELGYRSMYNLNSKGFFGASGGADDRYVEKIFYRGLCCF